MEDLRAGTTQDEKARVFAIIRELIAESERYGRGSSCVMLPRELERDLERSDFRWLSRGTYVRLSKWCNHDRPNATRRELFVEPRAREISTILFGTVIDRVNS